MLGFVTAITGGSGAILCALLHGDPHVVYSRWLLLSQISALLLLSTYFIWPRSR